MKKAIGIFVGIIFFLVLIGIISGLDSGPNYEITDYVANVEISDEGDAYVKEYMVIDGSLNGFMNQFYLKNPKLSGEDYIYNPKDITDFVVGTFDKRVVSGNDDLKYFKQVYDATTGDSGVYTITDNGSNYEVKIYRPTKNDTFTIYMEYKLDDVVVIHNDVAEFYYNFFSNGFNDDIDNVEINISLPSKSEEFRYFGHGGLQGTIEGKNNEKVTASMIDYVANTDLDIRVVFDPDIIKETSTLNKTNKNKLDDILQVEEKRALEANEMREKLKNNNRIYLILNIVYTMGLLGLFLYIYFKYDKELKSDFNLKYYREFIDDYDVEVVDYLMTRGVSPNAMSASIMNLIYKKKIKVDKIDDKNYTFNLIDKEGLSDNEQILVDFLFKEVGKDDTFTTKELNDYAKSTKTCDEFNSSYTKWKNSVIALGTKEAFYESHTGIKWLGVIYGIIGVIIYFASREKIYSTYIFDLLIIPIIAFIIYVIAFTKKTKKGNEHYAKWNAFKNFLNDFGNFSVKDLPEVVLWERYLVYAVVFGLADKVKKVMNVKIQEFQAAGIDVGDVILMNYYWDITPTISRAVSNSVNLATRAAASKAAASSASSGGFGGGFSSGGGFGGGGRGGGGF